MLNSVYKSQGFDFGADEEQVEKFGCSMSATTRGFKEFAAGMFVAGVTSAEGWQFLMGMEYGNPAYVDPLKPPEEEPPKEEPPKEEPPKEEPPKEEPPKEEPLTPAEEEDSPRGTPPAAPAEERLRLRRSPTRRQILRRMRQSLRPILPRRTKNRRMPKKKEPEPAAPAEEESMRRRQQSPSQRPRQRTRPMCKFVSVLFLLGSSFAPRRRSSYLRGSLVVVPLDVREGAGTRSRGGVNSMVCSKCEKKLQRGIHQEMWKEGSRHTIEGGGRAVNENKALSARKRWTPYGAGANGAKCRICKQSLHQEGIYCQKCAYARGQCSMCGVKVWDTTYHNVGASGIPPRSRATARPPGERNPPPTTPKEPASPPTPPKTRTPPRRREKRRRQRRRRRPSVAVPPPRLSRLIASRDPPPSPPPLARWQPQPPARRLPVGSTTAAAAITTMSKRRRTTTRRRKILRL